MKILDPVGCEQQNIGADYSDDETEFIHAMDTYIHRTGHKFPKWTEAMAVLLSLGYRRVAPPDPPVKWSGQN